VKPLFKNNVFTNPQGWAQKIVGATWRYRWMQLFTVILGLMLEMMITLVSKKTPWADCTGMLVFVFIAAIALPLCYLRALRYFVLESQSQPILRKE
jgi:hypothetical protein